MNIKWAPTNKCNLNCKTCYNANLREFSNENLNIDILIEKIHEFKMNGVSSIQFLGGEPIMFAGISALIKECSKLNIDTWINTNGTLLDFDFLKCLSQSKLKNLIISLDGINEISNDTIRGNGTFKKVISILDEIHNNDFSFQLNISSVISKQSIKELDDYLYFITKYPKINSLSVSLPDIVGNAENNKKLFDGVYDLFLKKMDELQKTNYFENCSKLSFSMSPLMKDFYFYGKPQFNHQCMYCMGGSYVYFLDSDGILYPCNLPEGITWFKKNVLKYSLEDEYNIFNNTLDNILKKSGYEYFFKHVRSIDMSNTKVDNEYCNKCTYRIRHLCNIGCPCGDKHTISKLCIKFLQNYHEYYVQNVSV